jgi:hypothetical protein
MTMLGNTLDTHSYRQLSVTYTHLHDTDEAYVQTYSDENFVQHKETSQSFLTSSYRTASIINIKKCRDHAKI